ncbi:hypothetical protein VTG60DRAFT_3026 [Thermothelomyces hinnuleus]
MAPINHLPTELMSEICARLERADLWALTTKCFDHFANRFFSTLQLLVTRPNMELLRDIAEHPIFRKRVREVFITPSFFEGLYDLPLYIEKAGSLQPWLPRGPTLDPADMRRRYAVYTIAVDAHLHIAMTPVLRRLLEYAFKQFPNLKNPTRNKIDTLDTCGGCCNGLIMGDYGLTGAQWDSILRSLGRLKVLHSCIRDMTTPPATDETFRTTLRILTAAASSFETLTVSLKHHRLEARHFAWEAQHVNRSDPEPPELRCFPPCTFVLPPRTLKSKTTISIPPATETIEERWPVTKEEDVTTVTAFTKVTKTVVITIPVITTSVVSYSNVEWTSSGKSISSSICAWSSIDPPAVTRTERSDSTEIVWTYSPARYPTPPTSWNTDNHPPSSLVEEQSFPVTSGQPGPPVPLGMRRAVQGQLRSAGIGGPAENIHIPCIGLPCPDGGGNRVGPGCHSGERDGGGGGGGGGDSGDPDECEETKTASRCQVVCTTTDGVTALQHGLLRRPRLQRRGHDDHRQPDH